MPHLHSSSASTSKSETGQAAVLIAILLFFAFLAFAALAIDGAMTYLVRRDLQNVADSAALAACRVIASGDTSQANAISEAQKAVQAHLGDLTNYAVGTNPPNTNLPNAAADVNLLSGIKVSSADVRVALRRQVPTVLTQFVGRGNSIMIAQARCDARGGGGPLPIAVQRYDGGTGRSQRDHLANKSASPSAPALPLVPYPTDSLTTTVSGHYGPFGVPVPLSQYTAADGGVNDPQTGPEITLLGNSANTNNTPKDFSGFVMPDIRNVGSINAVEYYNGAQGQSNTLKDVSMNYIYAHGYPGPMPDVGSQLGILDGVSAKFAPQAVRDSGYQVGDLVPVYIYDGYTWSTPDYTAVLAPIDSLGATDGIVDKNANNGYPVGCSETFGDAVRYQFTIKAASKWSSNLFFDLTFWFSEGTPPPGTHVKLFNKTDIMPGLTYQTPLFNDTTPWTATIYVCTGSAGPTSPTQTLKYLSGLNVMVKSNGGVVHGSSANYGFYGPSGPTTADYDLRTESGGAALRQGDTTTELDLIMYPNSKVSNGNCNANVTASLLLSSGGTEQPWSTFFSANQTFNLNITRSKKAPYEVKTNFAPKVKSTAPPGNYYLKFTVASCGGMPSHSIEVPISLLPSIASNANVSKFVFLQGYALFRISYTDSNDVKGYAVSPIYFNYQDVVAGRVPRLVPWGN